MSVLRYSILVVEPVLLLCDIYGSFILVVKLSQFHFGGEIAYSLLNRDW